MHKLQEANPTPRKDVSITSNVTIRKHLTSCTGCTEPRLNYYYSKYNIYLFCRFILNVVVSDATGPMEIQLQDREVRVLIGQTATQLLNEVSGFYSTKSFSITLYKFNHKQK